MIYLLTGERSFKCATCGKGFFTAHDLKTHEKYRHITERNFKCDKCVASFTNSDALKRYVLFELTSFIKC